MLSSLQNERRNLSPIYREGPLNSNLNPRNCLSPITIKSDSLFSHKTLNQKPTPPFNLEFEYTDPSVKFTRALEERKIRNHRACVNLQCRINQLKEQVDHVAQCGKAPLGKHILIPLGFVLNT